MGIFFSQDEGERLFSLLLPSIIFIPFVIDLKLENDITYIYYFMRT